MKIDEKGIALLKDLEGLRLDAYRCSADKLTIGYGHTSNAGAPIVVPGLKITKIEADRILRRDVAYFENEIGLLVKHPLTQGQWNAVVSFVFNTGVPAFAKSTLLKKINSGDLDVVPGEMMKWCKFHNPKTGKIETLNGLLIRRRAETAMWRSLEEKAEDVPEGDMRLPAISPEPKRAPYQSKEATTSVATSVAGALLVAHEMKDQIEAAEDLLAALRNSMHDPNFVISAGVVLAGLAIYLWRTKRLREDETA